jgi:membrane protein implicated in regulation of membrane protease activity
VSGGAGLWLSAAGLVTGFVVWLLPTINSELQLFIFSLLSVIALLLWHRYGKRTQAETDHPLLNKRGQQYVGRVFDLYEAIENGQGKIKVDDSIWTVHGEDCNIYSRVRIIAVQGTVFEVEKVETEHHKGDVGD